MVSRTSLVQLYRLHCRKPTVLEALAALDVSPAPDLNYFRNKVSNLVTVKACFQAFSIPELGYTWSY